MPIALAPTIPGISGWVRLARGRSATVWKARQESLNRMVAVKVDDRTLTSEPDRQRYLACARALGGLSGHPGIVTVHDAGILEDGRPFLVMDVYSGDSLERWLTAEHRPNPALVRVVAHRLVDALAAAHAQGLVHGNLKPSKILLDEYQNPALVDFAMDVDIDLVARRRTAAVLAGQRADVRELARALSALLGEDDARLGEPIRAAMAAAPAQAPSAGELRDQLAAVVEAPTVTMPPRRRRLVSIVLAAVIAVLVLIVGGSGLYLYQIDRSVTGNLNRGIVLPAALGPGSAPRPAKDPQALEALDYVLIGTDEGDPDLDRNGRSDSIMLVHLNQARDQAYVVSLPRDSWVDVPGRGKSKINTAMASGGPSLVVQTVEELTRARVDHVVMIDFEGFIHLTDDLGSVTLNNRIPFSSHGYDYPKGKITMSGDRALWFVREGRALPTEQDRAENQRTMLKAILSKGLSPEVVRDPVRFTRFLGNAAKHIEVDNALTNTELRATIVSLRLSADDIVLLSAPLSGTRTVNGQRVGVLDQTRLAELGDALRHDTMADYLKKYPRG